MYKIAVYGKGGVGKSSVSSNLSYLLSLRGLRVLHVGCDPKHDSTRLLTGGIPQKTFLDSLGGNQDDVIVPGTNGIYCAECGGAEPGTGCAGKGMAAMLAYVEQHTPEGTDVRICDVLGDVVCGGFSVPMRKGNADGIIIVISEEFMSIYAANNILRGIRNLNGGDCVLGLILNSREPQDRFRAESFASAAGLRILGEISRSSVFSEAEKAGKTVSELHPDSPVAIQLGMIADEICRAIAGETGSVPARPLSDKAMMQIAAGQPVTDTELPVVRKTVRFDAYDAERRVTYRRDCVMPACTSHGAVQALLNLGDAAVVLHGADNCAFLNEYAWRRESHWQGFSSGYRKRCNLFSTGMDGENSFAGDAECLKKTVRKAVDEGFRYVFVVPTCASEIIGTDMEGIISSFSDSDAAVKAVPADPRFLQGRFGAYSGAVSVLCGMIDWDRQTIPDTVSFLGLFIGYLVRKENRDYIDSILSAFGLRRGGSFFGPGTVGDLLSVSSSQYLVCTEGNALNDIIARAVPREVFRTEPLAGMRGLRLWVGKFSEMTGRYAEGEAFLKRETEAYNKEMSRLRPKAEGKKVLFYIPSESDLDWRLEVLRDLGMEVVSIAHWNESAVRHAELKSTDTEIPRIENVEFCSLGELADSLGVDLIISGDPRTGRTGHRWTGMAVNFLGRLSAEEWAGRAVRSLSLRPLDGWDGGCRE